MNFFYVILFHVNYVMHQKSYVIIFSMLKNQFQIVVIFDNENANVVLQFVKNIVFFTIMKILVAKFAFVSFVFVKKNANVFWIITKFSNATLTLHINWFCYASNWYETIVCVCLLNLITMRSRTSRFEYIFVVLIVFNNSNVKFFSI